MDWNCTQSPNVGPGAAQRRVVSAVNLSKEVDMCEWKWLQVNLHEEGVGKRLMEKYQRVIEERKSDSGIN